MVKTYRAIHQWDHWLQQGLGSRVLQAEETLLQTVLQKFYGKHVLLIGSPGQHVLLNASVMSHQLLLSPLASKSHDFRHIESELYRLPILSGSVDLVLLPHTLEHLDNPHELLAEACRIVKPEGHIVIFGFNPWSAWGIKKWFMRHKNMPWSGNFIHANQLKKWLALSGFELVRHEGLLYAPPVHHAALYKKLKWLEWVGRYSFLPVEGVYMVVAQAKMIPLTPIKMRWQQQLSGVRATIPKPTIRSVRNF